MSMRQQGGAVDVTVTQEAVLKGEPVLADGFHGIAMQNASSGDEIAIEIAQRVHELNVGSLTAAKGDILYITAAGALTNTVGSNKKFGKVVSAKDSNSIAWVLLLPQQ